MAGYSYILPLSDEEYASLPPLVKQGEDAGEVFERIVGGWCTSFGKNDPEAHIEAGGVVLDRIAFVDENMGESMDEKVEAKVKSERGRIVSEEAKKARLETPRSAVRYVPWTPSPSY